MFDEISDSTLLFNFLKYILKIYLAMTGLSCSMWDPLIVPWPRIKPGPPVSGAQSHWITGEVPIPLSIKRNIMINMNTKGEKKM